LIDFACFAFADKLTEFDVALLYLIMELKKKRKREWKIGRGEKEMRKRNDKKGN